MTQLLEKTVQRLQALPEDVQNALAAELQEMIDQLAADRPAKAKRTPGLGKGRFTVPADFTDPLPESFWLGQE
ncbi:MAG: prevent-host-death protein [Pseudomonadota bacterium]